MGMGDCRGERRREALAGKSKQLLLELFALKQDKLLDFVFLSVVNLKTKTPRILLCGNVEDLAGQLSKVVP